MQQRPFEQYFVKTTNNVLLKRPQIFRQGGFITL